MKRLYYFEFGNGERKLIYVNTRKNQAITERAKSELPYYRLAVNVAAVGNDRIGEVAEILGR